MVQSACKHYYWVARAQGKATSEPWICARYGRDDGADTMDRFNSTLSSSIGHSEEENRVSNYTARDFDTVRKLTARDFSKINNIPVLGA